MGTFTIEQFNDTHRRWAGAFVEREWGSARQVSRGVLYHVLDYPGFVVIVNGQPQGIVTYQIANGQCEVLLLHSAVEGIGAGSALIEHVIEQARRSNCTRIWLITTNDNYHAIRWYQKRGFTIAAVHVNALEHSRKLKPEIPMFGNDGIPLRDEIEFEMLLT